MKFLTNLFDIKKDNMIKMIKKFLFGLIGAIWFVWFWFFNFTDASLSVRQIWVLWYSPRDSSVDISVLLKWTFHTLNLGVWKRLLMYDNSHYVFWYNWLPYFYVNSNWYWWHLFNQWVVTEYSVCDYFDYTYTWDYLDLNCSSRSVTDWSSESIGTALKSITNDDYFIVSMMQWRSWWWYPIYDCMELCISSKELNRSICFWWKAGWYNWNYVGCGWTQWDLTWSLNLPDWVSFDYFDNSMLWFSPWVDFQGWGGSSSVVWDSTLTWNVVYWECTNWQVMNWYQSKWYSSNLCYAWIPLNSTWIVFPIAWQGVNYFDLYLANMWEFYTWWKTIYDWFRYWRSAYINYNNWSSPLLNPFSWYDSALPSYFSMVQKYGIAFDSDDILDYCFLQDNEVTDLNALYDWFNFDLACSSISDTAVLKSDLISSWYVVGSDWSAVFPSWSISGWSQVTDWTDFINKFFNLVTTKIWVPSQSDLWLWVLPSYIIISLLWLLLFRFLSH